MQLQGEDACLGPIGGKLEGKSEKYKPEITVDYVLDDSRILWNPIQGRKPRLTIPFVLVSSVIAPLHRIYGHPGNTRTVTLIGCKYW